MKKGILLICIFLITITVYGQDPYIVDTEGLGKYAFVDSDAVTWVRLNSSTHGNVDYLTSRWWTGEEDMYNTPDFSDCISSGLEGSTGNFSHGDLAWATGEIAYVSAKVFYCGGGVSGNFNENQYRKIDVNTTGYTGTFPSGIADNRNNLVGTFVINSGAAALTLDRLWLSNTGTSSEVSDIPNDGIKIFYEDVTGTEVFDGTENSVTIYGNYGGNAANNNEYGNDDMNIPVAANTNLRLYVVISDLNNSFTTSTTAQFSILNDGISFQETLNGKNLMRIDVLDVSGSAYTLPVELTKFQATPQNNSIRLDWQTATEQNNSHFEIQKSIDGKEFSQIGTLEGFGTTTEVQNYTFVDENPVYGQNYYRLKQVDFNGDFKYSDVTVAEFSKRRAASFYPNPTKDELSIESNITTTVNIQVYNLQGQLVRQFTDIQLNDKYQVNLSDLNSGVYQLQLIDANSFELLQQHRLVKQ